MNIIVKIASLAQQIFLDETETVTKVHVGLDNKIETANHGTKVSTIGPKIMTLWSQNFNRPRQILNKLFLTEILFWTKFSFNSTF